MKQSYGRLQGQACDIVRLQKFYSKNLLSDGKSMNSRLCVIVKITL